MQSLTSFQLFHLPHIWRRHPLASANKASFFTYLDLSIFQKNTCDCSNLSSLSIKLSFQCKFSSTEPSGISSIEVMTTLLIALLYRETYLSIFSNLCKFNENFVTDSEVGVSCWLKSALNNLRNVHEAFWFVNAHKKTEVFYWCYFTLVDISNFKLDRGWATSLVISIRRSRSFVSSWRSWPWMISWSRTMLGGLFSSLVWFRPISGLFEVKIKINFFLILKG